MNVTGVCKVSDQVAEKLLFLELFLFSFWSAVGWSNLAAEQH
jgi:hypothetical protein